MVESVSYASLHRSSIRRSLSRRLSLHPELAPLSFPLFTTKAPNIKATRWYSGAHARDSQCLRERERGSRGGGQRRCSWISQACRAASRMTWSSAQEQGSPLPILDCFYRAACFRREGVPELWRIAAPSPPFRLVSFLLVCMGQRLARYRPLATLVASLP